MKQPLSLLLLLMFAMFLGTSAWEWPALYKSNTLSMQEVSGMRVRDIKRRLIRQHGYSPDEIAKMLDKKELIQALAFEEHKDRQAELGKSHRELRWKGIITAVLVGAMMLFWPLLKHLYEVASVNFVVYTDRKRYEAARCLELKSVQGGIGVLLMGILDLLQIWLTLSVILGWVMTSKYFFPIPNLPIRPAALMGGPISQGPLSMYGINVGPMVVTWSFRFLHGLLEGWVGRALKASMKRQRQQERADESPEEKAARKMAKKAKKEGEKQQREEEERRLREMFMPRQTEQFTAEDVPQAEDRREAAAQAAELRRRHQATTPPMPIETHTAMDELD
jgi:hypothetical protein